MRSRLVRCPSDRCEALFPVPLERLGRRLFCPECGERSTARPHEVDSKLRAQEGRIRGAAGSANVSRLPLTVLLDNVRSLWNVGAMFRTADAFGVEELVLAGITACPPRPQISKTALGAELAVSWSYRAEPLEALQDLRSRGYTAVALESTDRSTPLERFEWPARCCLVVGNEVVGVSLPVVESCDARVSIPMHGVKDSLNVAVAFGIAVQRAAESIRGAVCADRDGTHESPPDRKGRTS